MVRQGEGGSIVVISSVHADRPYALSTAYNAAKAGVNHMARTWAVELARHRIRVNVIEPGWIDTPGERKFFTEDQLASGAAKLPFHRLGRPDEVAKAVAYLLSDDAEYATGSTLLIDGGVSLPWWSNRAAGEQ
jgi:glucose 1-dehydrogenase